MFHCLLFIHKNSVKSTFSLISHSINWFHELFLCNSIFLCLHCDGWIRITWNWFCWTVLGYLSTCTYNTTVIVNVKLILSFQFISSMTIVIGNLPVISKVQALIILGRSRSFDNHSFAACFWNSKSSISMSLSQSCLIEEVFQVLVQIKAWYQ